MPIEIYKRLSIIPQTFLVDEHHVHVYASKGNTGTIVRADRPVSLFRNSIATPSIVTACIVSKYQNHLPLERQSKCFKDNGIKLETNTLANWMMKSSEYYLSSFTMNYARIFSHPVCSLQMKLLATSSVMDERSVQTVTWWVYSQRCPMIRFVKQSTRLSKSRRTDHPKSVPKRLFRCSLFTDGYQVYHTLDKEREDLRVAGVWVHAKRKFAELVKASERKRKTIPLLQKPPR